MNVNGANDGSFQNIQLKIFNATAYIWSLGKLRPRAISKVEGDVDKQFQHHHPICHFRRAKKDRGVSCMFEIGFEFAVCLTSF